MRKTILRRKPSRLPYQGPHSKRQREDTSRFSSSAATLGPVDPSGLPLFCSEWIPSKYVSQLLRHWVRRPLSKKARKRNAD